MTGQEQGTACHRVDVQLRGTAPTEAIVITKEMAAAGWVQLISTVHPNTSERMLSVYASFGTSKSEINRIVAWRTNPADLERAGHDPAIPLLLLHPGNQGPTLIDCRTALVREVRHHHPITLRQYAAYPNQTQNPSQGMNL